MADLDEGTDVVTAFAHKPGAKLLVLSAGARGFATTSDDLVANTRKGRQVLNLEAGDEARIVSELSGDHLAVVGWDPNPAKKGERRYRLLAFPLAQIPEMARGKGVRLLKLKEGEVSDVRAFTLAEGLAWTEGGQNRTLDGMKLAPHLGNRGEAGREKPKTYLTKGVFG
jgi:topoisomerase-4 subunit A